VSNEILCLTDVYFIDICAGKWHPFKRNTKVWVCSGNHRLHMRFNHHDLHSIAQESHLE